VIVGLVPYTEINVDAPISAAFNSIGLGWAEGIIAFGALVRSHVIM
jgi:APA family basic amino acid/polyamine antiporter